MNFSVEVARMCKGEEEGTVIAKHETNSVLSLAEYIQNALDYFEGMVKFNADVIYVGLLVRTYKDHHVISIMKDDNGSVKVRSNQ